MAAPKPEGWHLDILPVEPDRLAGGERSLVITTLFSIVIFVLLVAPRLTGAIRVVVIAAAAVIGVIAVGLLRWAWHYDCMLSKTLPRFLGYPAFIPAHATTAASPTTRRRKRRKRHLPR